jgi:hypothetical protein
MFRLEGVTLRTHCQFPARQSMAAAPATSAQSVSDKSYSVADPDPGSGAFLTPRSRMGKKSISGSGDEHSIIFSRA